MPDPLDKPLITRRVEDCADAVLKAMAAIPLTRGNPNWREQKARSFRCRHCGGSGEAITITGAESPDQPTMANCSCGESWQLTSRRKH